MRDGSSSKFEKLIATLQQKLELTGIEIADILWLAQQNQTTVEETSDPVQKRQEPKPDNPKQPPENNTSDTPPTPAFAPPQREEPKAGVYTKSGHSTSTSGDTLDIKVPDAPGLREPLKLARALRPLMQKIDSETEVILDEEATANRIAKEGIRIPVFQPAQESAFDLVLVVDESNTMIFWQKTIQELQQLLEVQGAFRDVQVWGLLTNQEGTNQEGTNQEGTNQGEIYLRRGIGKTARKHRHYKPRSLVDPSGKRLFLLASDCVTDIWHNGKAFEMLKIWAQKHPVAIIQMLPQWLWQRTGLSLGAKVQFSSLTPRIANQSLLIKKILLWDDIDFATGTKIPIFTLEEDSARTWSKMIGGRSDAHVTGFVFTSDFELFTLPEEDSPTPETAETAAEITSNFRRTASPMARKLASLLSAAPVITLPIVRIIQAQMLKESQQVHVAEVFLGGILKRKQLVNPKNATSPKESVSPKEIEITPETNPDHIEFDFINEEIRDNFLQAAPVNDSLEIIEAISKHFAKRLGKTLIEFNALLRKPQQANNENIEIQPFALLTAKVLKRLGGDYIQFAEQMEQEWGNSSVLLIPLSDFNFEVVTVDPHGEEIKRETKTAQYYTENLGNNVILEMVAIPGGKFLMGSPETEAERSDRESPQHEVTVPPFFMGKYPVTQAQWKFVASLPLGNRKLKSNPFNFKGENRPVDCVSWFEAVEFCQRLSQYTGKNYRLPSEAEWEYACRAGTTTPFHFGETITSEFANYNAKYTYGAGVKGTKRGETTEVGDFGVANAFGLYDMHGNVWEWCVDKWHSNYKEAPTDGSAWIETNDNQYLRLLRGGSWNYIPRGCRSASRGTFSPVIDYDFIGFRVVCGVFSSRTLSSP